MDGNWELLESTNPLDKTYRLKIPIGWLYRYISLRNEIMVFVPEDHMKEHTAIYNWPQVLDELNQAFKSYEETQYIDCSESDHQWNRLSKAIKQVNSIMEEQQCRECEYLIEYISPNKWTDPACGVCGKSKADLIVLQESYDNEKNNVKNVRT